MPRKASQAAKKDTAAAESKSEGGTTRRSGRATAKTELKKDDSKEATRSRRSSTAAQTAASVADSKTPKRSASSRRDSTSPSDGRQKSRRGSVESPATRVKSTRRATGRINYKESDGEDESAAPKYDDNFESNEEFDSESDEKNKPKGRTRGAKSPAKGHGAKDKPKGGRGRRGRPKKQSSDEDEPIELSEESVEIESETIGKKPEETPKEATKSGRGRKSKADTEVKSEEKPKSSRRSARASVKEETPKKRPSRGVQAKKYTEEEEEDDDIEEIHDSKADEEVKPQDSSRKRRRGSATEANKKLKGEDEGEISEITEKDDDKEEAVDENDESKPVAESKKEKEKNDESMETDNPQEADKDKSNETSQSTKEEKTEEKSDSVNEEQNESKKSDDAGEAVTNTSKEKLNLSSKQESVDSSENLDESMHSFDSDQGSRAEQSISSGLEDSQDAKETKPKENEVNPEVSISEKTKSKVEFQQDNSNSFQELDDSSESKSLNETCIKNEQKKESMVEKKESNPDQKADNTKEVLSNASDVQDKKSGEFDITTVTPPTSSVLVTAPHSKESSIGLNGSEKVLNPGHTIHSSSAGNLSPEDSAPKANGAHDLLNNSVSDNDQYYPFPGRKYVVNTKLSDSIRQSVKDKSFGFVSYNLGISASDSSIQKEKLLNELNKLDAHIICIQQVSKPFYCGILEPSLDALGFKGTFSQPDDSEKGLATFYKSSLFRLSGQTETSLKQLIEKELEASSLDVSDQTAVKSYVKKCGHVLFTHFATVIGMHSLTVANVQVPPTDLSIHALQVSCLAKEVVRINGGSSRPFLLGGEFNMMEAEAPYQLLRDGYLSNDMIEELQRRKDVVLPGKENAALVNLLWKSFQHPSSTLCSCYKSVLDQEVSIPEKKMTSQDLLWYSSDSLYTVGVLDVPETLSDHHFSLKADIAFSV